MFTKKENLKNEVKNSKTTKTSSPSQTQENHSACCQPTTKSNVQTRSKTYPSSSPQTHQQAYEVNTNQKASSKTRVTIKYDAGFPNQLYIRGKGANLSWDKGQPLKNIKADEWIWETDAQFNHCEFKVLINDHVYENGDNHCLNTGSTLLYTPYFY